MSELTRHQRYYRDNIEREKARKLKHYHENKHRIDREKQKEYNRRYHQANPKPKKTAEQKAERNRIRRERYATDAVYREKVKADRVEANRRNPHRKRAGRLKSTYGLTTEAFDEMAGSQNHRCAICRQPKKLVVDHCHATGRVRGLLCQQCNIAVGHMQDDPAIMRAAAHYLDSSSSGAT